MLRGFVKYWHEQKSIGGVISDGICYLVLRMDIEPDEAGRQFLIEREWVTFEISENRADRAANVCPVFRDPVMPEYEVVTLRTWHSRTGVGWAVRKFGGDLRVETDYITTEGIEMLRIGSKLWVLPAPPNEQGHHWIASQAEICIPDDSDYPGIFKSLE